MARSGRTPASTSLLSFASPVRDDTYSSSRRAPALAFLGLIFFDLAAPFFGAISQIQLGFGGGCKCECEIGNGRTAEEDKMAKWQRWKLEIRWHNYKALSPPLCSLGFLGNRSCDLRLSESSATARWAVTWAFAQPQPTSPIYRRRQLLFAE